MGARSGAAQPTHNAGHLVYEGADGEEQALEIADGCAACEMEWALVRVEWALCVERLGLSEQERALVELLCEGYTQAEIAAQLGLSQSGVARCLARVERCVRQILEEDGGNWG